MNCYLCTVYISPERAVLIDYTPPVADHKLAFHPECLAEHEVERQLSLPTYVVAVYDVDRVFGGYEEGGWYYPAGTVITSIELHSEEAAEAVAEGLRIEFPNSGKRYSVLNGDDYDVEVLSRDNEWDLDARFDERLALLPYYPIHRPHYE